MKGSLKDCFWIKNIKTRLGLDQDNFTFDPLEDSTVSTILKEKDWLKCTSRGTPFCVGVLDPRLIQKSGIYPGASSSGSIIDIESGSVDFSITTDTGGSTIAPSARAKLYGFKPTYGRISRYGLNPLCAPLDVVSIMSKDKSIIKKVFSSLDQPDPKDCTCLKYEERKSNINQLKLCIPENLFSTESLNTLLKKYPYAKIVRFEIPYKIIEGAYFYLLCPEFYSNMAKFDGVNHKQNDDTLVLNYKKSDILYARDHLNIQIKSRINLGAKLLLENYNQSLIDKFRLILQYILGDNTWIFPIANEGNLYSNNLKTTSYCILSNITRRPALTLPSNLPQGYFLMSPSNTDYKLLDLLDTSSVSKEE